MVVTRFAPSPTGHLHIGHAFSALFAHHLAKETGGHFLLRIEDIDPIRCKPEFISDIYEDLHWLGLTWEEPVRLQSEHLQDYQEALDILKGRGLVYPCFCSRKDIMAEIANAGHAPHLDDAGVPLYPGTCRALPDKESQNRMVSGEPYCWRLDIQKALVETDRLSWEEEGEGIVQAVPENFGDIVLARKDVPTSYHLSVVVDDHLQGVTLVTRGEDLKPATSLHRLLQNLLGYKAPAYRHHKLLLDAEGKRFAKRNNAVTLRSMRESGRTPDSVVNEILNLTRTLG